MWRFKPFMPKEQSGLEGRTLDIGKLKLQVRNMIAEGGFSTVFLARDLSHASKHYALKHMICNDEESLQLVIKEISVMKSLKGHPNIVTLLADTMFDMGRTKEAILVMEYCEKSLVTVLENRGAAYFDEKQILTIFRDICNAVFAMHNQSPPIAHRDLKAENLLLGSDGLWKLCDFGSTSTNHKVFEKPEEMGIEEDNIRKHTTPAYRSPEMWDLYRREVINEKVDIWALGCLLFRICYLKSAFDGESKLQILNGNYKIPELPKYSSSITNLIKDMLQSSPNSRPDISQVWFRVNGLLPDGLQKSLPDNSQQGSTKTSPIIQRSPQKTRINTEPVSHNPMGAFWSTEHANDRVTREEIVKVSPVRGEKNVLEGEISKLKDELAQVKMEKAEITSKYEKLSAICKSQRLEIQELKQAAKTPLITKESSPQPREKIEGTVWELEQNMVSVENNNNNNNNKQWEAFTDDTTKAKSVRTRNSVIKQGNEVNLGTWGFGSDDDFRAVPTTSGRVNVPGGELRGGNNSQTRKTESMTASQPAGWAGF